jgi:hypothetical protein
MDQGLDWGWAAWVVEVARHVDVAAAAAVPCPRMLVVYMHHSLFAVAKHKSMRNKINILLRRD